MDSGKRFDVAVIGLGAMGSSALYHLARHGAQVIGLDRFYPPHEAGSSHGETRITRRANGEGDSYAPLAIRSHDLWREIETETGSTLLHECGALIIAPVGDTVVRRARTMFLQRTLEQAERFGIDHELLDAQEIRHRFPQFNVQDDEIAYYEPGGGYLAPEHCIAVQLDEAKAGGATIETGTCVREIRPEHDCVRIMTDHSDHSAGQVIVTAGAWAGRLLGPPFDSLLQPIRQQLHWFAVAADHLVPWHRSPVFSWSHGGHEDDFFYGFPCLPDSNLVKTSGDRYAATVDPDEPIPAVTSADGDAMYRRHVAGRLAGVTTSAVRSATCLYTVTPDSGFLIDRHPDDERIIVVSPCSGHGFKHSPAIGESVASLALHHRTAIDLSSFSLDRFKEPAPRTS